MAKVSIYTTAGCIWCKKSKEWFKAHKIKYEEYDVGEDAKAREEMIEKSGQMGVPVIMVDDQMIIGFDDGALKKALKVK